jgi:hypothetical protein
MIKAPPKGEALYAFLFFYRLWPRQLTAIYCLKAVIN